MSNTTNTNQARSVEAFENGEIRRWIRLSLERMAFTTRGRFAFLAGALILILLDIYEREVGLSIDPDDDGGMF